MVGLPQWLRWVYVALMVLGFVGCAWFVFRYTQRFRWWSTEWGRHLIAFSSCVGLFMAYFLLLAAWPGLPWKNTVRTALFASLIAIIWWRVVMLERVMRTPAPPAEPADRKEEAV